MFGIPQFNGLRIERGRSRTAVKKEFLLKFASDRRRWLQWLFEAKKRYGLSVLNYMVTSNHIHLVVRDNGEGDVIHANLSLTS